MRFPHTDREDPEDRNAELGGDRRHWWQPDMSDIILSHRGRFAHGGPSSDSPATAMGADPGPLAEVV